MLLLLCVCSTAYSQTNKLYHKIFDETDGLLLDKINTVCLDNEGFLWLGGDNLNTRYIVSKDEKLSIQRFSGELFHSMELPVYNNPILSVRQIYKRQDGTFYITTKTASEQLLLWFNPVTAEFKKIIFADDIFEFDGLSDVFLYKGEDYILTQKNKIISLQKLSNSHSTEVIFSFKPSVKMNYLVDSQTQFIAFDTFLIIADDNFPIRFFDWSGKPIDYTFDTTIFGNVKRIDKYIDEVFTINNKSYVFLEDDYKLYEIDSRGKSIISTSNTFKNEHLKTYNDPLGNHIIASANNNTLSISQLNSNKSFKENYTINVENLTGIKVVSNNLKNNLWLTIGGELHYFKFPKTAITTFLNTYSIRKIKALDSINYLIATERNGWKQLNTLTKKITSFNTYKDDALYNPKSSRNIVVNDSLIWSNSGSKIIRINKRSKAVTEYKHYPIVCLEQLNDSTLIYGTNGYNLMAFNTKTKVHKPLLKTDSLHIFDFKIYDNTVFAGTDKGIFTYDVISKKHQFYKNQLIDPFILTVNYHKDYGFLAGTKSGKIIAFNSSTKTFKTIYEDQLSVGIASILFDDDNWWINTFNGLVHFNPKTGKTSRYSEEDGLSHFEGNRYSALKTKTGIFEGTLKGLNFFKPEALIKAPDSAALTLLKLRRYDETRKAIVNNFNRAEINTYESITLPAENRTLDIDFGLKNKSLNSNSYTYKYRLNNGDWTLIKYKSSLQFPNLSRGKHQLDISAYNYSGDQVANILKLNIVGNAFFYETWWFILSIALITISILLYLLRQSRLRKKLQDQFSLDLIQSQENERKRIARDLHDSVSQQLTLIKRKAQHNNYDEISNLTNSTLEEVRHISRGLFPPLLKQLGLTESIEQLALDIDENNDVFVSTDIENIDNVINENQALHLYRFIQECTNNILKHSKAKAFSIIIEKKQNRLIVIQIKDNGQGFDVNQAKNKNSLGLKTLEERTKFLGG